MHDIATKVILPYNFIMASVNYLYRSKKEQASLKVRLLYRYNGIDYQLETDSKILVTHDYWIQYHRKTKIKDVSIRNKQREIEDCLNALEKSIIESFYKSDPKYIDKAWLVSTVETHYKHGDDFKSEYLVDIANDYVESIKLNASKATLTKHNTIIGKIEDIARNLLPKAWREVLLYDPTMNKHTKAKTLRYANVNFWTEIAGKNNRSYNYHHRKLYGMTEGNTCAIQAQVEDLMLETLDGLV